MAVSWSRLYAERAAGMRASAIREAFRLSEDPRIISFAGGFPGPEFFPVDEVVGLADGFTGSRMRAALQYTASEGSDALRAAIAARMTRAGMPSSWEEILITTGSQQALDLWGRVFLDPGDTVVTEAPAYAGALNAFGCYQATYEQIPLDEDGMLVERLAEVLREREALGRPRPKFAYVVPNFHNPSGVTLSEPRRRELLRIAHEYDFPIVEDDPYGELRYEGEALPSLFSLDSGENTVYFGSFSKVFLPGLRVGWIRAPREVIRRMAVAKQAADLCSPSLSQWLVLRALEEGLVDAQIQRVLSLYRERRDAMLAALEAHMPPEVTWNRPGGGFFIWLHLPEGMGASELLPRAIAEAGVAYVPGSGFYASGSPDRSVRLAYSQQTPGAIEEGIRRLAEFIRREMRRQAPVAAGAGS